MLNQTLINVILDRSGSMASIRRDMELGFDHFIQEQKKYTGDEVLVSLYQFDDQYETVYTRVPLVSVSKLRIEPRGSTALLDALGRTINGVGEDLAKLPENQRPARVVVLVITDGMENFSREFNQAKVADLVKQQEQTYSWKFIFLGANQDAVLTATALNIPAGQTMTFAANSVGVNAMYASTANNMRAFRSGNSDGLDYSVEDRVKQQRAGAHS